MSTIFSYLAYGFFWLLSLLPLWILYAISDLVYFMIYYIIGYRKKVVRENLKNSFPEKSKAEREMISKEFYSHFCDMFLETIKLISMSDKEILKRCTYKNLERLEKYHNDGKSVVAILGHYGNWEWTAAYPLMTKALVLPIYKPLHNKVFDKMYIRIRERFGAKTLPKKDTLRTMIRYKNQNQITFTAFLGDQAPGGKNLEYWTKFLNQETPVLLGAEKVAKKFDQPVVYMEMQKIKRGYYEVEAIPLFDNPKKSEPFEITEKQTRMLEETIRKNPAYWLWSHKRWKYKRTKS